MNLEIIFQEKKKRNIRRNFYVKERIPCKCISIIMIDSVIKANTKYYLQTLLEECKYLQEKIKKTENYIDEELEKSVSESDSNDEIKSDIDNKE